MKKYLTALFIILLTALSIYAQNPIIGKWDTKNHGTIISVENVDGQLQGIIKSSGNPKAKEGTLIIRNLKENKDGYEGEIYSIKQGKWMDAEFTPMDNMMEVKVSVGFISKTVEWERK